MRIFWDASITAKPCMESVADGMESMRSIAWNQAAGDTPSVEPSAFGDAIHAKA